MITLHNLAATNPAPHAATALTPGAQVDAGTAPAPFAAVLAGQRAIAAGGVRSEPGAMIKGATVAAANTSGAGAADPASELPGFAALVSGERRVAANGGGAPKATERQDTDAVAPAAPDAAAGVAAPGGALADIKPDAPAVQSAQDPSTGNVNALATPAAMVPLAPVPAGAGAYAPAVQARPANPSTSPSAAPPGNGKWNERARAYAPGFEIGESMRAPAGETGPAGLLQSAPAGEHDAPAGYLHAGEPLAPAPSATASANAQSRIPESFIPAPQSQRLDAPIGSARWGEQLSNQVIVLAQAGTASADIRVTPPELGPVQVRISVTDGVASVVLSAPAQDTRYALEAALPELREAFAGSGISLGESSVSEEHPARQGGMRSERESRESLAGESAAARDVAARPRRTGLLDMYA